MWAAVAHRRINTEFRTDLSASPVSVPCAWEWRRRLDPIIEPVGSTVLIGRLDGQSPITNGSSSRNRCRHGEPFGPARETQWERERETPLKMETLPCSRTPYVGSTIKQECDRRKEIGATAMCGPHFSLWSVSSLFQLFFLSLGAWHSSALLFLSHFADCPSPF